MEGNLTKRTESVSSAEVEEAAKRPDMVLLSDNDETESYDDDAGEDDDDDDDDESYYYDSSSESIETEEESSVPSSLLNKNPPYAATLKRSASSLSAAMSESSSPSNQYHRGQKCISSSAGLSSTKHPPPHYSYGTKPSAADTVTISANPELPPDVCLRCNDEYHAPILNCAMVASWRHKEAHSPLAVQVVPAKFVQTCMERRIREFSTANDITYEAAGLQLRLHKWDHVAAQHDRDRQARDRKYAGASTTIATFWRRYRPPEVNPAHHDRDRRLRAFKQKYAMGMTADDLVEYDRDLMGQEHGANASAAPTRSAAIWHPYTGRTHAHPLAIGQVAISCSICYETFAPSDINEMVGLNSCEHRFCRECWAGYLRANVEGPGSLMTVCPHLDCKELVSREFIVELYPEGLETFDKYLLDSLVVAHNRTLRWCPGPDCKQIAVKSNRVTLGATAPRWSLAHCGSCQTRFCLQCGQAPHGDAPCPPALQDSLLAPVGDAVETKEQGTPEEDLMKPCPACGHIIQKISGCNHMVCRCRHRFCWLCLVDLSDRNYDHVCGVLRRTRMEGERRYQTDDRDELKQRYENANDLEIDLAHVLNTVALSQEGKLDEANEDDFECLQQETQRMERFAHYYKHHVAHDHGQRYAADQWGLLDDRINKYTMISGFQSGADSHFITEANLTLVAARRLLKFSCMYTYAVESGEITLATSDLYIFEFHLEQLIRYTERLSELSEHPLSLDDRFTLVNQIAVVRQCIATMCSLLPD